MFVQSPTCFAFSWWSWFSSRFFMMHWSSFFVWSCAASLSILRFGSYVGYSSLLLLQQLRRLGGGGSVCLALGDGWFNTLKLTILLLGCQGSHVIQMLLQWWLPESCYSGLHQSNVRQHDDDIFPKFSYIKCAINFFPGQVTLLTGRAKDWLLGLHSE